MFAAGGPTASNRDMSLLRRLTIKYGHNQMIMYLERVGSNMKENHGEKMLCVCVTQQGVMKNLRSFGKDQFELNGSKGKDKNMSGQDLKQRQVTWAKFGAILGEEGDHSEEAQGGPRWAHEGFCNAS